MSGQAECNEVNIKQRGATVQNSKSQFMEKTEFFVCKCHDVSHQLVLETLETEENEEHVVYGCFHIVHLEFWEKLKCAMKSMCMKSPSIPIKTSSKTEAYLQIQSCRYVCG